MPIRQALVPTTVGVLAGLTFAPSVDIVSADKAGLARNSIYGLRPRYRGRFHQVGAVLSVPAGLYLVFRFAADDARASAALYALTWFLMFATSASYHRLAQSITARFWMRRLDHSMIFVHIAGATTPVAVLGVGGRLGTWMLYISWGGAALGVIVKLTQLTIDQDPLPWLIPLMAWLPALALPALLSSGDVAGFVLLLASLVIYAGGGLCFRYKRPNPAPMVFGFHEIFHLATLVAGACQFALTLHLVSA